MDQQTQSSVDWTSIINSTIAAVPSWIALARNQPVVQPGQQGVAVAVTPQGASASISPGLILAGVVGIVALVYLMKR